MPADPGSANPVIAPSVTVAASDAHRGRRARAVAAQPHLSNLPTDSVCTSPMDAQRRSPENRGVRAEANVLEALVADGSTRLTPDSFTGRRGRAGGTGRKCGLVREALTARRGRRFTVGTWPPALSASASQSAGLVTGTVTRRRGRGGRREALVRCPWAAPAAAERSAPDGHRRLLSDGGWTRTAGQR